MCSHLISKFNFSQIQCRNFHWKSLHFSFTFHVINKYTKKSFSSNLSRFQAPGIRTCKLMFSVLTQNVNKILGVWLAARAFVSVISQNKNNVISKQAAICKKCFICGCFVKILADSYLVDPKKCKFVKTDKEFISSWLLWQKLEILQSALVKMKMSSRDSRISGPMKECPKSP